MQNQFIVHESGRATCGKHTFSAWNVNAFNTIKAKGKVTEVAFNKLVPEGRSAEYLRNNLKLMAKDNGQVLTVSKLKGRVYFSIG